jgi:hypothetical protein
MEVNSHQMNSRLSVRKLGLRGNSLLPTILSRMVWQKERTVQSFVGYSETSKAYKFYIPGHRHIETSRDVTFDEDATFNRSRQNHSDEIHDEEPEAPRVTDTDAGDDIVLYEHDMEEPKKPADSSREMNT